MTFKSVERKEDWKRPEKAPKNWRSKVNDELWRRIDPGKAGADDVLFTNRAEVDRDANLLKAFSKLEERQKASHTSGET